MINKKLLLFLAFLLLLALPLLSAKNFTIYNSSNGAQVYFLIDGTVGNVGIGTPNALQRLHVNGNILSNGTINATTDVCIQGGNCLSGVTTTAYVGIVNTSMYNYVNLQNTSQNNWISGVYNTTRNNYIASVNTSMYNYVNLQNTSQINGLTAVMTAQNTSQTNYINYNNISVTNAINAVAAIGEPNWNANYTARTGSGNVVFSTSPTLTTPTLGAATATTLDTGYGANELYDMNQHVLTSSAVTFATINTGSGAMELNDSAIANGDVNSIPSSDQVYDFVIGLGYTTTTYVNTQNTSMKNYVDGTFATQAYVNTQNTSVKNYADSTMTAQNTSQTNYINSNNVSVTNAINAVAAIGEPNWNANYSARTGSGNVVFSTSPTFTTPTLGAATATTLDTGQGANELYDMNQNVLTSSAVTFATINTGSGAMELNDSAVTNGDVNSIPSSDQVYDFVIGLGYATTTYVGTVNTSMKNYVDSQVAGVTETDPRWTANYSARTGSGNVVFSTSPTFTTPTLGAATATTIDTGYGANELYDMNQHVLTSSAVTFATINTGSGAMELNDSAVTNGDVNSIPSSDQVYDFVIGLGYGTGTMSSFTLGADSGTNQSITNGNVAYIAGSSTISTTATATDRVQLAVVGDSIGNTQLQYDTGQALTSSSAVTFATIDTGYGANELYDMNQHVLTTSAVTFATLNVTGVSSAATFNSGSGNMDLGDAAVANGDTNSIPTGDQVYDFVVGRGYGTGSVVGAGTSGYLARWNGTTSLNNSYIYENAGKLGFNTTAPQATLALGSGTPSGVSGGTWGLFLNSTYSASFDGPVNLNGATYITGTALETPLGYFAEADSEHRVGPNTNTLVVIDYDNRWKNHDHGASTNPTIFVHSATDPDTANTQWASITHNTTGAVYGAGTGPSFFTTNIISTGTISGTTFSSGSGQMELGDDSTIDNGDTNSLPTADAVYDFVDGVNTSMRNYVLYVNSTNGAGGGGGTMSSFTLGGTSGTNQTISNGNVAFIAAGTGISTTAAATDRVIIANTGDTTSDTIADDGNIALTTETSGNYVASVSGVSGITIAGSAGEGWTPTVYIAPAALNATHLGTNSVAADEIAASAVGASEIADSSINWSDLNDQGGVPTIGYVLAYNNSGLYWKADATGGGGGIGNITGGGTASYIPRWVNGTNLGNSIIYQSGTTAVMLGSSSTGLGVYTNGSLYDLNENFVSILDAVNVTGANITAKAFIYWSDERLKDNITEIKDSLEKVKQLEGVTFDWRDSGKHTMGLIAQDVEKVFPEVVSGKGDELRYLEYGNLIAPVIEAIKELDSKNTKQDREIEELRNEIELLKLQVAALSENSLINLSEDYLIKNEGLITEEKSDNSILSQYFYVLFAKLF